MQKYYYIAGSGLYCGEPFSYLWPFSQALAATVSMADIPGLKASTPTKSRPAWSGCSAYLDTDNSGAPEGTYTSTLPAFDGTRRAADGPRRGEVLRRQRLGRDRARAPVRADRTAPRARQRRGDHGVRDGRLAGERRNSPARAASRSRTRAENTERNTVTNAPAAELAHAAVPDHGTTPQYLQFAEMAYEWVRHCLLQPSGLYADHISTKGVVEPTLWSYNQGTMIGAGTLLYQATGNGAYLYQARQTARPRSRTSPPNGSARKSRSSPRSTSATCCTWTPSPTTRPGPRSRRPTSTTPGSTCACANDLFVSGSPPSPQLLVQAAIVQIYALLSSPPSTYF